MPVTWPARPSASRRAVLGALGGTVLLAGCGVRLEEDAPNIPFVPRRDPVPGEQALIALEAETRTLASVAPGLGGELGATLAPMFAQQAQVVRDVLLHGGLPADKLRTPASELPADLAPDAAPTARLAAAGVAPVSPPALLAGVDPTVRPTIVSLAAQRAAAAFLLTGTLPDLKADAGQWTGAQFPPAMAQVYLALLNAGYLFEVVAAQTSGDLRARALAAAAEVRTRAGLIGPLLPQRPSPPLGAALPERITDEASATTVAQSAVTTAIARLADALPALTAGSPSTAGTAMNRGAGLLAPLVVLGNQWGVALTAFPGLS